MRGLVLVIGVFANGCFVSLISTPSRNAPGDSDVASPPRQPAPRAPEQPKDPGTHVVEFTVRGLLSGGFAAGAGRDARWAYANGVEASLSYGRDFDPTGLQGPETLWGAGGNSALVLVVPDRAFARRSIRVNFGWLPDLDDNQPSRLYAELEIARTYFALGLGYVWEPNGPGQGLQATATYFCVFVRGTYLHD
jgi:hypothetical protein